MKFLLIFASFFVLANSTPKLTTADRIRNYGYPAEQHTATTSDDYLLSMYRIPYSPILKNKDVANKPVILLQHGLISSSDCWILNGPENALAYLLVDAGYDVWLGNFRGNTYSRKNVYLTPLDPEFWAFSWHEMGMSDLPAEIDYILDATGECSLHYIGHSQGTTAFFAMLSTTPRYNIRLKSTHLLAPVGYMNHMKSPLAKIGGPLLGRPSILTNEICRSEFLPNEQMISLLGSLACQAKFPLQRMCENVLFLIAGWGSKHMNCSMLPDVYETHPAGASTCQIAHYLQEYNSGYFGLYDFGAFENEVVYNSYEPPIYNIANISPKVPINFYYSICDV